MAYYLFTTIDNDKIVRKISRIDTRVIKNYLMIKLLMKKDQNLSIIIDAFSRGGAQKVLQLLIPEFVKRYKSVTLFLLQDNKSEMQLDNLEKLGLKIYRLEAKSFLDFRVFSKFLILVTKSKPSQIQAHLYWSQIWSIFIKFLIPKVQIYWVEHNTYLDRTKLQWTLYKLSSILVKKIVAVSYEASDFLLSLQIKKSIVVFNPISTKFTTGIKNTAYPSFLFVGRLNKQKNPGLLIDSFDYAIRNNVIPPSSRLSICGEGSLLNLLIEKVNQLPFKELITFYGFLDEETLSRQYQESMVLVSTSDYEGFSLVRAEALASGCTIVTTNTSGIKILLTKNEELSSPLEGVFIVNSDAQSVANGMAQALDTQLWTNNSIKSRVEMVNKLSATNIADLYCNL